MYDRAPPDDDADRQKINTTTTATALHSIILLYHRVAN